MSQPRARPRLDHATMRRLPTTRLERVIRRWSRRPRRARHFLFCYEHVLGTSLELQVTSAYEGAAQRAEAEALAEIDRLALILSGWSSTSELALWLATYDADVPVSAELAEVLHASATWRARTGGAFDPGAQAVVDRLRAAGPDDDASRARRSRAAPPQPAARSRPARRDRRHPPRRRARRSAARRRRR